MRYAVAGGCVVVVLVLLGWFSLREPPSPAGDHSVKAATAQPRVRHVAPRFATEDDADRETLTNQIAESTTTNAAVLYREAFALYDALSKEQKDLVSNWRTNADASVEAELCEKIQPICELMHQATAATNCDWGIEQPITFETRLPHLSPCRNIARTAIWSAAHCRTGKPVGAVDDLLAASRLGQKVSQGPVLISYLVDLAIQGLVMDSVAAHAGILVGAGDTRLAQLFTDTNYDEGLRRAFEQEADVISREAELLARMSPEEAMRKLKFITSWTENSSELQSIESGQAIADIRQVAELQREYADALELPEAEYRKWLDGLQAAEKTNAFVKVFVSDLGLSVDKTQLATISAAMVVAGLAVMQEGPGALQSHLDPATGQPFIYTQTTDGFELQSNSTYQILGKPVKLRFK
jgi:hypothetical protein